MVMLKICILYTASKNTEPLRSIWHNFTSSQHLPIIFGRERPYSNKYGKKFLNWFKTSCVVSTTTDYNSSDLALGWIPTTYYRQSNKRVAKRLRACVNAERLHFEHLLQLLTPHTVSI